MLKDPGQSHAGVIGAFITLALSQAERHSADPKCDCRTDAVAIAAHANEDRSMRQLLLTVGFIALAIGMLWIGQGTGVIKWPQSSFMISQIQWAGYGAALAGLGLILIWQGKR